MIDLEKIHLLKIYKYENYSMFMFRIIFPIILFPIYYLAIIIGDKYGKYLSRNIPKKTSNETENKK